MKPTTLVSTRLVVAYEARSDLAGEVNRSYVPHNALTGRRKVQGNRAGLPRRSETKLSSASRNTTFGGGSLGSRVDEECGQPY